MKTLSQMITWSEDAFFNSKFIIQFNTKNYRKILAIKQTMAFSIKNLASSLAACL